MTAPALFLGHGSPLNAIQDTPVARAWAELGRALPRPTAALVVSAHWLTRGTFFTGQARPPTIHDFGGFPPALHAVQYPAPGDPALARRAASLLGLDAKAVVDAWGLDHGAWSVLRRMYPAADVPVVQMSLDVGATDEERWEAAARLGPLREEGVLILASGNITHNLGEFFPDDDAPVAAWARDFDALAARALTAGDREGLLAWRSWAGAPRAHPTPDHFWPLLTAAALRRPGEPASFPVTGFQHGTFSMRGFRVG